MADYETITVAREGGVLVITLNRPKRLNAASLEMAQELGAALYDLGGARAILLTGAGRAFCSGADLQSRGAASATSGGDASHNALLRHYNPVMLALAEAPVPVVSAVNGAAAGIGCSVALAADFAIAARSAYFLQAFVNIGLVPDGGASWMLPRLIGKARATEMMLLGEKIPAEKAEQWGLIHRCVDDAALMDEALALAAMRRNIMEGLDGSYAAALHREAGAQRQAGNTADAREGTMAFLEKRKPGFKGE